MATEKKLDPTPENIGAKIAERIFTERKRHDGIYIRITQESLANIITESVEFFRSVTAPTLADAMARKAEMIEPTTALKDETTTTA